MGIQSVTAGQRRRRITRTQVKRKDWTVDMFATTAWLQDRVLCVGNPGIPEIVSWIQK